MNITVGTFATSSLCSPMLGPTRTNSTSDPLICSPCSTSSITCIDVSDHSHAQTLWACLGASENIFPPKARPDCGLLIAQPINSARCTLAQPINSSTTIIDNVLDEMDPPREILTNIYRDGVRLPASHEFEDVCLFMGIPIRRRVKQRAKRLSHG